jgi:hypothetical protein
MDIGIMRFKNKYVLMLRQIFGFHEHEGFVHLHGHSQALEKNRCYRLSNLSQKCEREILFIFNNNSYKCFRRVGPRKIV